MSIITRLDAGDASNLGAPSRQHAYDHGLAHDHHWARDREPHGRGFPTVADAARVPTPSSARHDDILFSAS